MRDQCVRVWHCECSRDGELLCTRSRAAVKDRVTNARDSLHPSRRGASSTPATLEETPCSNVITPEQLQYVPGLSWTRLDGDVTVLSQRASTTTTGVNSNNGCVWVHCLPSRRRGRSSY